MSDELGAGFFLDQTFDFDVGESGDLRGSSGVEELNKDLAFQLKILLGDFRGQPLTPELRGRVKSITADTIRSDNRVLSISENDISVTRAGRERIRLTGPYTSESGDQEFVFEV